MLQGLALNQCMAAIFRGLRQFRRNVVVLDGIRNLTLLAALPIVVARELPLDRIFWIFLAGSCFGLVFGLGYVWILFSPQKLAWHDWASDTRVVVDKTGDRRKKMGDGSRSPS